MGIQITRTLLFLGSGWVRTGVDDLPALAAALAGCDAVAHCAGINRELGRQTYRAVHIDGTRHIVEAAKAASVRRILLLSFLRARPECGASYHESKYAAEEIVRSSGLQYTILKPGVIYGRGDHMLDHLSHALYTFPIFPLVGMRDRPVRPVAVDDVARIARAALVDGRLSGETVAVLGPDQLPLGEAVRRVARVIGLRRFFFRAPFWIHLIVGWLTERLMVIPLASLAQVRILREGVVDPVGETTELPADLVPQTPFDDASIRSGLPKAGRFAGSDLRACVALRASLGRR
ncbi:MAG: NAD(P)H-binding protein [Candidatus Dormibacteria bacterium]